jgi:hypothetical protein
MLTKKYQYSVKRVGRTDPVQRASLRTAAQLKFLVVEKKTILSNPREVDLQFYQHAPRPSAIIPKE